MVYPVSIVNKNVFGLADNIDKAEVKAVAVIAEATESYL